MYVRAATGRYWISCFIVGYHNLVSDLFVSFGTAVFHILNEGIEYITRNDHLPYLPLAPYSNNSCAIAVCPRDIATSSGVSPSFVWMCTSAPCLSSGRATAR